MDKDKGWWNCQSPYDLSARSEADLLESSGVFRIESSSPYDLSDRNFAGGPQQPRAGGTSGSRSSGGPEGR